jgi:endonuclease-3
MQDLWNQHIGKRISQEEFMRLTQTGRREMLRLLASDYQGATTGLVSESAFELLIAVMLSAQCTDVRVNIITQRLFPHWNTPAKMLALNLSQLEDLIRDCGLFRAKAKNILATCQMLQDVWQGEVPATLEDLMKLPGVGRKTANVVLSHQFGVPAIAVDTHVFRVSNRTGLACGKTPDEVEQGLMKLIPRSDWSAAHHWLIWHGRKICRARNPLCGECSLATLCPAAKKDDGKKQANKL